MRKISLWTAAAALVAGALYFGLVVYPQQRFHAALDLALQQLPTGFSRSYKAAEYSLLSNRATISDLALHAAPPRYLDITIDTIELIKPSLGFLTSWSQAAVEPGPWPRIWRCQSATASRWRASPSTSRR